MVPALALDREQSGGAHSREMAARGLRRDSGDPRQLAGGQRAAVHQRHQHAGPRRIPDQRRGLGQRSGSEHDGNSEIFARDPSAVGPTMLRPQPKPSAARALPLIGGLPPADLVTSSVMFQMGMAQMTWKWLLIAVVTTPQPESRAAPSCGVEGVAGRLLLHDQVGVAGAEHVGGVGDDKIGAQRRRRDAPAAEDAAVHVGVKRIGGADVLCTTMSAKPSPVRSATAFTV